MRLHLHKRIERLETKLSPAEPMNVHLIGMEIGDTQEAAQARYGQPIGSDDQIIFLVPMEARDEAA